LATTGDTVSGISWKNDRGRAEDHGGTVLGLLGFLAFVVFEKVLGKAVSEEFRYSDKARWRNDLLSLWYRVVENPLPMPVGLSLVCVAVKDRP